MRRSPSAGHQLIGRRPSSRSLGQSQSQRRRICKQSHSDGEGGAPAQDTSEVSAALRATRDKTVARQNVSKTLRHIWRLLRSTYSRQNHVSPTKKKRSAHHAQAQRTSASYMVKRHSGQAWVLWTTPKTLYLNNRTTAGPIGLRLGILLGAQQKMHVCGSFLECFSTCARAHPASISRERLNRLRWYLACS